MAEARCDGALVVTDVGQPYVRKGLIYLPVDTLKRSRVIVLTPHIGLQAAHEIIAVLDGAVLRLREK